MNTKDPLEKALRSDEKSVPILIRRPYSAPFVKRLDVGATAGKKGAPGREQSGKSAS